MRASDVVMLICGSYGLIPMVEPTGTFHSPLTHELVQRGTDLAFVRKLARDNGCWFWISVNPVGLEVAHFASPPVSGFPVATLSLYLERSAFDELDIEFDADRPTSVTSMGLDVGGLETVDASVPQSAVPAMAGQSLASINGGRTALAVAPGDDAASLTGPAQAVLNESEFFVRATGTTTHARVGRVLHAHEVVQLDGLGRRHSGNWLVAEVRHLIDAVSHRMECTFVRNGWES
jgi:phage protein D